MRAYVVQAGDHLAEIATRLGFDVEEVWNHEANRPLREVRANPRVLSPGDVLHVPEAPNAMATLRPQTTNRFIAAPPRVRVDLQLHAGGTPHANVPFRVKGLVSQIEGTTNGDGHAQFEVPAYVRAVALELPSSGDRVEVALGGLDPVETARGARMRLVNLGYLFSDDDGDAELDWPHAAAEVDDELAWALAAFQRDAEIPITGVLDDTTRAALLNRHGV